MIAVTVRLLVGTFHSLVLFSRLGWNFVRVKVFMIGISIGEHIVTFIGDFPGCWIALRRCEDQAFTFVGSNSYRHCGTIFSSFAFFSLVSLDFIRKVNHDVLLRDLLLVGVLKLDMDPRPLLKKILNDRCLKKNLKFLPWIRK